MSGAAIRALLENRLKARKSPLKPGEFYCFRWPRAEVPGPAWLAAKSPDLRVEAQVPDDPQPLGIGFGKNEPALLAAVNGALVAMQRDRSMDRLKNKWGVP
ncbi:MAG: hypothetical protein USCAAHI_00518 [Beijerinckiaceae bacterium]|nr:MAG: hypothetical protein USCAAHI_00518 [Beijerinckiaceae bacterium]